MKKLKNTLLLSCKKVTQLIEKRKILGNLSLVQQIQLWMHVSMCKACQNYMHQSDVLDEAMHQHFLQYEEGPSHHNLSDEAKKEIIELLKEDK